jgi:DNA-binding GntR family transcriptional regulator
MASVQKLKSDSLEERVYRALCDAITRGELRPGDPLVEAQLSEDFGTSKTPVREALIRLARDGLVEAKLHHMTRVATPTADDIRRASEVRAWIECALVARCALDPAPSLLRELQDSIAQSDAALSADSDEGYGEAVRRFSDVIVEASENTYAREFLSRLQNVLTLIAHISRETPGRRERSIVEHRAIYKAIKNRDPEAAAEATRVHLASIERDSLEALGHHLDGES